MTGAYDSNYLDNARVSLARMLDFAVHDLRYDIDKFFTLFIKSSYAKKFEIGDPRTIVGMSGIELAYAIIKEVALIDAEEAWLYDENYNYYSPVRYRVKPQFTFERSREYWAGGALAYYQWVSLLKFRHIVQYVPPSAIREMYDVYHELDISQFIGHMDELL